MEEVFTIIAAIGRALFHALRNPWVLYPARTAAPNSTKRSAFRRRDVRQRSRSFALQNRQLRPSPNSNQIGVICLRWRIPDWI
jgi:hypothetical protein